MRELKQDWTDIFRGFRLGLDLWKIALAFCGLVLTGLGIWVVFALQGFAGYGNYLLMGLLALSVWVVLLAGALRAEGALDARKLLMIVGVGVVLALGVWVFGSLPDVCVRGIALLVILTIIWGLFCGAITRSAVVELATDERIGMGEAVRFAAGHYRHYIWSVLAPVVGIVFFMLVMMLGGVVAIVPVLNILVALTTPLYLIAGFVIMLILVGLVAGMPMLFPAISSEGSDSFDAIGRAYSYVYSKPWRLLWYYLVGTAYVVAVSAFVIVFAFGVLKASDSALSFAMGARYTGGVVEGEQVNGLRSAILEWLPRAEVSGERVLDVDSGAIRSVPRCRFTIGGYTPGYSYSQPSVLQRIAGSIAMIGVWAFGLGVAGLLAAICASVDTVVYLLMRKAVDGTDMTDIFQEEEEEEDYLSQVTVAEPEKEEGAAEKEEERAEEQAPEPEEKPAQQEEEAAEKAGEDEASAEESGEETTKEKPQGNPKPKGGGRSRKRPRPRSRKKKTEGD